MRVAIPSAGSASSSSVDTYSSSALEASDSSYLHSAMSAGVLRQHDNAPVLVQVVWPSNGS